MRNNPIRVLHVIGGVMDFGGTEMFLMNYYRQIDKNKVQFDFLLTGLDKGVFDDEIVSLGGQLFNVPSKKQNVVKNLIGTYRILKSNQSSIVHSHLDGMNGLIMGLSYLAGNKVRISHSHNTQHLTTNRIKLLIHNVFRILSRISATDYMSASKEAALWLHGKRIAVGKNTVIVNGIDYKRYSFNSEARITLRNKLDINDRFVLGHVGRFHFQKNHMFLLELVSKLVKFNDSILLILVGDGEARFDIESKIEELEIQKYVLLVGKSDDTSKYYNAFDSFLLPSVFEGLGIVAIEAQVNGLNVIASMGVPQVAKISEQMIFIDTKEISHWTNQIIESIRIFALKSDQVEINRFSSRVSDTYEIKNASLTLVSKYIKLSSQSQENNR